MTPWRCDWLVQAPMVELASTRLVRAVEMQLVPDVLEASLSAVRTLWVKTENEASIAGCNIVLALL